MRRLQISIDEDLDEALGVEAVRRDTSKAAHLSGSSSESDFGDDRSDPMIALIGDIDEDAGDFDRTIYGA